jgi:SAM-dependent methyltransferase
VVRPVPSIFAPAEELSAFLPPDSFDIVHCRNALDHSFDPLRGVIEMLRLVRIGGVVVLYHNPNEAQSEDYSGFHQYNFDVQDDRFIIWRGEARFDVLEHMPVKVRMQSQKAGHVVVSIEKLEPFPVEEDSRFRQRFAESISAMMNLLIRHNLA